MLQYSDQRTHHLTETDSRANVDNLHAPIVVSKSTKNLVYLPRQTGFLAKLHAHSNLPAAAKGLLLSLIIIIIITLLISSKRLFSLIYNDKYLKLNYSKIPLKNAVLLQP